jgi:hypothetical protein
MELKNISENEKIIVSGNKFLNRKLPLFGAMFPLTGIMIFSTNNIISKNIGIGTLTIERNKWFK